MLGVGLGVRCRLWLLRLLGKWFCSLSFGVLERCWQRFRALSSVQYLADFMRLVFLLKNTVAIVPQTKSLKF